jgi:cytochrome P450
MTTTDATTPIRIEDAPMSFDRAEGWKWVRALGDVVEQADGSWLLTSHDAVRFAQRNPDIFSSARAFDSLGSPVPLVPIASDPPDHKRFRKVLDPMLAPRVINDMEDELRLQVRTLISAFAGDGKCDVVDQLARLYPTQVFLTLFGLPLEDRDQFITWAESIIEASSISGDEVSPELLANAMELFTYLQGYVDEKRAVGSDDMLGRVLALDGEDAFSNEEVLGMCFLFVLAGLDTVTAVIGFMLEHLARRPDLRRRLREEPDLIGPVIEEVLRLEQPAAMTPRVTTRDVEVGGRLIPEGAKVMVCLGTANRDGGKFPVPDDIDPAQADNGHVGFGGGIHRCLGSHLARRELRLVLEEFLAAIPDFQVADGVRPEIVWPSGTLHLKSLPLVFPVAAAG